MQIVMSLSHILLLNMKPDTSPENVSLPFPSEVDTTAQKRLNIMLLTAAFITEHVNSIMKYVLYFTVCNSQCKQQEAGLPHLYGLQHT
jgi:hypothetical protein